MARKSIEEVLANDSATVGAMFGTSKNEAAPEGEILRELPLDQIWPNKLNFYRITGTEELADSIRMNGLLDPLVVYEVEPGGPWCLISGHRRWDALHILNAETALCRVVPKPESEAAETIMLIQANSTGRVLTPLEIAMQAEKLTAAYVQRKKEGADLPGRVRDFVAETLGTSPTALARKKVIKDKLAVPGFRQAWDSGKMPEAVAYELARLPRDDQYKALDLIIDTGKNYESVDIKTVQKVKRQIENGESSKHDLFLEAEKRGIPIKDEDFSPLLAELVAEIFPIKRKDGARAWRTKAEGLEFLHRFGFRHVSRAGSDVDYESDPQALTIKKPIRKRIKWADVWELIALNAMREALEGAPTYEWKEPREYEPPIVEAEQVISEVVSDSDTGEMGFTAALESPIPIQALTQIGLVNWMTGDPDFSGRFLCTVTTEDGIALEQTCDWAEGEWRCYGQTLAGMFTVQSWWPLPPKCERRVNPADLKEDDDENCDN